MADPVQVDVLVVGGGLGGVAAAIGAVRSNASVILIESGEWLGGQLTAQGVCTPDEDPIKINGQDVPVVETCGATNTYKDMKHLCRAFYRNNTTLSAAGQAENPLNIGGCWVNLGFAVEATVAANVLQQMLADFGVQPRMKTSIADFVRAGRTITSVTLQDDTGMQQVTPKYILDATETGELLLRFGMDRVIGSEVTDEPNNMGDHPEWIQPITFPFALEHRPFGEDHTIQKPDNYDTVAATHTFKLADGLIGAMFTNAKLDDGQTGLPFWTYRRVVDRRLFNDPRYAFDIATINVGPNDFKDAIYPTDDPARDQQVLDQARNLSLCYLYWLQTSAPRDDGRPRQGWPELMPLGSFFNTPDAISPLPYIRESRRIVAHGTVKQQDIQDTNPPEIHILQRARNFTDSCGIGNYAMDVHAGANGSQEFQSRTRPYQIPAGALVPQDMDNVLAAGKCLGVTHITNGAYRLHPQEWNVGESAGALAAFCAGQGILPSEVLTSDAQLIAYQNRLLNLGIPLFWWTDITSDHRQFGPIQMLGVRGIFVGFPNSLDFKPNDDFPPAAQQTILDQNGNALPWPGASMTRAQAADFIARQLKLWG